MSQIQMTRYALFVRFEQGRGSSGVPKTWVPYLTGHPKDPQAKPTAQTLTRMTVELFRAACADPNIGHGRDLMPGRNDEYLLHNADGGVIEKAEDIRWENLDGGHQVAELVLTWRIPNETPYGGEPAR